VNLIQEDLATSVVSIAGRSCPVIDGFQVLSGTHIQDVVSEIRGSVEGGRSFNHS
jgi:hypothetical protein